jgi:hypothetical protein
MGLQVGVISDSRTRLIEDLVLVKIQQIEGIKLLERTQLPAITEELSLQNVIKNSRWDSCDVLILLNMYSEPGTDSPSLVVRAISTHNLKVYGLWVYPFIKDDITGLSDRVSARLTPVLADRQILDNQLVTSISLLRSDSPRLGYLRESTTYRLATELQTYPNIGLVERWNVRSPAFEQWLRQTEPSGLKSPDINIQGSLTETDFKVGLRLAINGEERVFPPETGSDDLKLVIVTAAATIANQHLAKPPDKAGEIIRFEQDARWFWKWGAYEQAASAADTAIYLGSKKAETEYLRALANLFPEKNYISNLPFAKTPTEKELNKAMYAMECFLAITPPGIKSPEKDRFEYIRYAEVVLLLSGRVVQAIYLGDESMPGTSMERERFRAAMEGLSVRAMQYYQPRYFYMRKTNSIMEGINFAMDEDVLPVVLMNFSDFYAKTLDKLGNIYATCFESIAQLGQDPESSVVASLYSTRRNYAHYPWVVDWGNVSPDNNAINAIIHGLMHHQKPEVRVMAYLMPAGYLPRDLSKNQQFLVQWLRWMSNRLADESEYLAAHPTPHTFALLGSVGQLVRELRSELKGQFPEAEWRRCVEILWQRCPKNSRVEYEGHTERFLQYCLKDSTDSKNPVGAIMPDPSSDDVVTFYKYFMLAPPPVGAESRSSKTSQQQVLTKAWEARQEEAKKNKPAPRLEIDNTHRPVGGGSESKPSATPDIACHIIKTGFPYGTAISAFEAKNGHVWLMYFRSDPEEVLPDEIAWVELNASLTTVLRIVRIINPDDPFFNDEHDVFFVEGGILYCVGYNGFYAISVDAGDWDYSPLYRMQEAKVWSAGGRLWVTGKPGIIYEYLPEKKKLTLMASAMRTPPTSVLDGREAYVVSSLFDDQGMIYVCLNETDLLAYDSATNDWRKIYTTRTHWSAGKSYPLELMLKGVGSGKNRGASGESMLKVLVQDGRMGGVFSGKFEPGPVQIKFPDGIAVEPRGVSSLGDSIWFLFTAYTRELELGAVHKNTGARERYRTGFSPAHNGSLFTVSTGFIFAAEPTVGDHEFYYIPREQVDKSYVRPAMIADDIPEPQPAKSTPDGTGLMAGETKPAGPPDTYRLFTNRTGQTMEAEILAFVGDKVTLRRRDGQVFTTALTIFSPADLAYLQARKDSIRAKREDSR